MTEYYKKQEEEVRSKWTLSCKQFRFMVSGSASLPTTLRNTWRKLSGGQVLLERYGMTGKRRRRWGDAYNNTYTLL